MTALDLTSSSLEERAGVLLARQYDGIWRRTDRLLAGLLVFQYVAGIVAALVVSPRDWEGEESSLHLHVWAAVILGGIITSLPVYLAIVHPGRVITRHVVAVGQMLSGALLIHLTCGRIETHFHVFGSLAFLAFYRDWKVLLTASLWLPSIILRGEFCIHFPYSEPYSSVPGGLLNTYFGSSLSISF